MKQKNQKKMLKRRGKYRKKSLDIQKPNHLK